MSFNSQNNGQCMSLSYSYDKTWPDLCSVKVAQNQSKSKSYSKLHNLPLKPIQKEIEERNHSCFSLGSTDCNKLRECVTSHQSKQTFSRITQHASGNSSQSNSALNSPTKSIDATKLITNEVAFDRFRYHGFVYKGNSSPTTSKYRTKEPNKDTTLVYTPAPLQDVRKSESTLKREAQRLEREQLEAIVSSVQAVRPDFSLEQATEDFPALNSTDSRKSKRVSKTKDKSKNGLVCVNKETAVAEGLLSTSIVKKSWKPKKKDPIHISLLTALESTSLQEKIKATPKKNERHTQHNIQVGNILDSDKPQQKRGKVRPDKEKKPTKLKCQILLERNERQKSRDEFQTQNLIGSSGTVSECEQIISPLHTVDDQLSLFSEHCTFHEPEITTCLNDQQPTNGKTDQEVLQPVVRKTFHSRRFREYCTNWLTEDLTSKACALLRKVALFQDRTFSQNPIKATAKRRYVAGISQTNKYLQVKKVKILVVAPDLERNCKEGGLDEKIDYFIKEAECQGIPCVFGPNRKQLGTAVFKKVFVSCVAVLNYEGAEDLFSNVLTHLHEAQNKYRSMTGLSTQTDEEDQESKPVVEPPESGLDEISASIIATLREELSPAEKLLKAIEHNCSEL